MLYRLKIELTSEKDGEICSFTTSSELEKGLIREFNDFVDKIVIGSKKRWDEE